MVVELDLVENNLFFEETLFMFMFSADIISIQGKQFSLSDKYQTFVGVTISPEGQQGHSRVK